MPEFCAFLQHIGGKANTELSSAQSHCTIGYCIRVGVIFYVERTVEKLVFIVVGVIIGIVSATADIVCDETHIADNIRMRVVRTINIFSIELK